MKRVIPAILVILVVFFGKNTTINLIEDVFDGDQDAIPRACVTFVNDSFRQVSGRIQTYAGDIYNAFVGNLASQPVVDPVEEYGYTDAYYALSPAERVKVDKRIDDFINALQTARSTLGWTDMDTDNLTFRYAFYRVRVASIYVTHIDVVPRYYRAK